MFPIPDEDYRKLISARTVAVTSDGTFQSFVRAVREIDPAATVVNGHMTLTVTTVESVLMTAADTLGALPRNGWSAVSGHSALMAISSASKRLLADGVWARNGQRTTPEEAGLDRAEGWGASFEQHGTGQHPQRQVFNSRFSEFTAAIIDVFAQGVPSWDPEVDYTPADGACFVTTATGLWFTFTANGPSHRNTISPDAPDQLIWTRY